MKRLIKKALNYDEPTIINNIKFEYTMDPGDCCICNEHILSDDGAYYAIKNNESAYICSECAQEMEDNIKNEQLLYQMGSKK